MIERVLWRIWMDEPVPLRYDEFWKTFADFHPSWQLITADDSSKLGWMDRATRAIFDRCATHAGRSDVLRYALLCRYGGIYVDCDVECLRPFDDLIEDDTPFAGWEDERMICPTVMGSPKGHPAMHDLLATLPPWFDAHSEAPPNMSTGPHFLTTQWKDREDVRLLDPAAFYPVHWSRKRELGGPYPPESYAVHHWDANWLPGGPPQR